MPKTKVVDIIKRVEDITQDSGVRWPRVELQQWLNEAYLNIIVARPDANPVNGTFTCVPGAQQDITSVFADALGVLDVAYSIIGGVPRRAVRQVSKSSLDSQLPNWYSATPTEDVEMWAHDPKQPKNFFVYPPATANTQLELLYYEPVAAHNLSEAQLTPGSGDTTLISLDDVYVAPLVDWVCYRAFLKDSDYAPNAARASTHLQAFTALLGAKNAVDASVAPSGGA
jgi:hypothetical protein